MYKQTARCIAAGCLCVLILVAGMAAAAVGAAGVAFAMPVVVMIAADVGVEFQISGICGVFETFIRTKCQFCIKYSNISN